MKQRVILARALLHRPELLFLDEPISSLDTAHSRQIHEELLRLNEAGTTIFLTTHDMEEAERLCDRIAFLHEGALITCDTPQNLRLSHSDHTITLFLDNGEKETIQQNDAGAKTVAAYMRQGRLRAIHSNEPTLGDVFIRLTGRKLT